jgi:hypothetical protein
MSPTTGAAGTPAADAAAAPAPVDTAEMARQFTELAQRSSQLVMSYFERMAKEPGAPSMDEAGVGRAFTEAFQQIWSDPMKLMQLQMNMWGDYMNLWQSTWLKAMGMAVAPVAEAARVITRGQADVMVAGGSSCRIHPTIWGRSRSYEVSRRCDDPTAACRPLARVKHDDNGLAQERESCTVAPVNACRLESLATFAHLVQARQADRFARGHRRGRGECAVGGGGGGGHEGCFRSHGRDAFTGACRPGGRKWGQKLRLG